MPYTKGFTYVKYEFACHNIPSRRDGVVIWHLSFRRTPEWKTRARLSQIINRFEVLGKARHGYCRALYKISNRFDIWNVYNGWTKFPFELIMSFKAHISTQRGAHFTIFHRNSNSMENWFMCNTIAWHRIATKCCSCPDSIAVVPCVKSHNDYSTTTRVRTEWNFHRL